MHTTPLCFAKLALAHLIWPKDGRWVKRAGLRGQTARHAPSVSFMYRCAPPGIFAAAPRCPPSATIPAALPDTLERGQVPLNHSAAHCAAVRGPTHPARRALNNRHRQQSVCHTPGRSPARTDPPQTMAESIFRDTVEPPFSLKNPRNLGVFFLSLPHLPVLRVL